MTGLKAHDFVVLAKFCLSRDATYDNMVSDLIMVRSVIFHSRTRLEAAGLFTITGRANRKNFIEAAEALRFYYPAKRGSYAKGLPTGKTALSSVFAGNPGRMVVWPTGNVANLGPGITEGETITPLHDSVPQASFKDCRLYEVLALLDVLRLEDSGAEERRAAVKALEERIAK